MKTRYFLFFAIITILVACNADPGVISDDDATPNGPNEILECDSLPAPNSVFSNAIGETLVFTDSTGHNFDTLRCVENTAEEVKSELFGGQYCRSSLRNIFPGIQEQHLAQLYFAFSIFSSLRRFFGI
ncbi:MAG: hypothetical protein IPM82_01710 [Saprospiraceae bacterium]|nr:hypothetical protein [Saprospiraceae bacterium]